ncbi:putative b3 domain-containing protein [Quercus suber]|uniref:B3 domain-containing protein n=1 Tax=Quercus suber TaxID=58331 RepID=A0AAW0KIK3_QUESU
MMGDIKEGNMGKGSKASTSKEEFSYVDKLEVALELVSLNESMMMRDREEENVGKGSKANTSKVKFNEKEPQVASKRFAPSLEEQLRDHHDHEDSARTSEPLNKNKIRKCGLDKASGASDKESSLSQKFSTLEKTEKREILSTIFDHEPEKMPPVPEHIAMLIKDGQCSTPFFKQLQVHEFTAATLLLSKPVVETCLFPLLNEEEKNAPGGVPVTAYDEKGEAFPMRFKRKSGNNAYLLCEGWKEFSIEHELRKFQDFVTLWMFRNKETDGLCFVVSCRRFENVDCRVSRKTG